MLSEKTLKAVKRSRAKSVLLQIPEGLKMKAQKITRELEDMGKQVFISCDPCFGACDIKGDEASRLGCGLIVHLGHSSMGVKSRVPVVYEYWPLKMDLREFKKRVELIEEKKIGIVTTIQYAGYVNDVKTVLESKGYKVFTSRSTSSGVVGQILGCEHSAALSVEKYVDCFLFFGSGNFHPLGLAAKTKKPVYFWDVESETFKRVSVEKEAIKKGLRLEKARDCRSFGILVSTKPGQARPEIALKAKSVLERKGKKAWLIAMERFTPEGLLGLEIDCLVNTACPRMTADAAQFGKPILNPEDIDKL